MVARDATYQCWEEETIPIFHPAAEPLTLVIGTGLHTGIKRKNKPNEDGLLVYQSTLTCDSESSLRGLLVVADGMGGHANGWDGSHMALQAIRDAIIPVLADGREIDQGSLVILLAEGVQQANTAIYQYNQVNRLDTGTTMTAALIIGTTAIVANVGDSRTYLFRERSGLRPLTRDHSTVALLVATGQIAPEEVYTHPQRNEIYRCLGDTARAEVDVFTLAIEQGMTLLLCSDGLWEMVRDAQIERSLRATLPDAAHAAQLLVQTALYGGGLDNISVIVAHIP